ncbi:MAG: HD domain-containing protein, partial [Planctomycetes bacterium]|nr:HD domain-containing protein [Planctomycetota bacterium]
ADPATDISALLPPPETPAPTPAGAGAPRTAERAPAPSPAPAAAIATPPTPEAVKKTRDTSRLTVTGGQRHITDRMRAAAAAEPEGEAAEGQRALFRRLFEDSYVTVRAILRDVERGRPVPGETVRALASNLAGGTLNDKDLLLNFVNLRKRGDYLVPHSLNVAILAINVGVQLGYEVERLGELGCAALLHDLGMLRLSEELLATRRRLSRKELAAVRDHPAAGLKALTSVSSYPETTPLVLYQEHERCDGSGYPEGTRGDAIHDFAKIVAVADVYDALISRRPWREAESPFKALADVLQMAESGLLDPAASRGLLEALSRFPVGSWVELTDGSVAKVVAARPDGLDRPEVAVLTSLANKSYQRVDLALEKGLSVARAVEGSERSIEHLLEGF